MKKIWFLLPTALLALALGSCGGGDSHGTGLNPSTDPSTSTGVNPSTDPSTDPSTEPVSEVNYYVVGAFNDWTKGNWQDYKMTPVTGEEDHYVYEHLALIEGQGLKCIGVKGDDVNNAVWYPDGMGNDVKADKNGYYDVHLHKTASEESEITKIEWKEDYVPEGNVEYFVVGDFNKWGEKDPNYKMTVDAEDANVYLYEGLELTAFADKFKVMDSRGTWYGDGAEGAGADKVVAEDGIYTIKFYVSTPEGKDQRVEAVKTGDSSHEYVPLPVESMDVAGQFNNWNPGDSDKLALADGVFSGALHLDAKSEVKVRINCDWTYSLGAQAFASKTYADGDGNIELEAGDYLITVQLGADAMKDFKADKTITTFTISAVA